MLVVLFVCVNMMKETVQKKNEDN